MISIRGTFEDGIARPAEPVEGQEGRPVIITFLDEAIVPRATVLDLPPVDPNYDPAQDSLLQLIEKYKMDAGIEDLAHQHDHYLHGRPKRP